MNARRDERFTPNAALIAAAFDHALIWWADEYSSWWDIIKEKGGDKFYDCSSGLVSTDPEGHLAGPSFALDPFGFPVLTNDLRQRLISEMKAAGATHLLYSIAAGWR